MGPRDSRLRAPPAADERSPIEFFDRDDAVRFLMRLAAEPDARDVLTRFAHEALGGPGPGARDLEEQLAALATCMARGTIVVAPIALPPLTSVRGEREEVESGVPVRPAEAEDKRWEGRILTTEPPRWKAGLDVAPPPRWRGRITVRET